nr:MAG TPA: hypothetical protein [Caudoviricetes sp.]
MYNGGGLLTGSNEGGAVMASFLFIFKNMW